MKVTVQLVLAALAASTAFPDHAVAAPAKHAEAAETPLIDIKPDL
jgi:hypothetical protein